MNHPNKKQQDNQKKFLDKLSEKEKIWHSRLFRIGNATYIYHNKSIDFEPTEELFKEWISNMENRKIALIMEQKGFEESKRALPFTRYVMEKNDIGYDQFLKENLSDEDYQYHKSLKKGV